MKNIMKTFQKIRLNNKNQSKLKTATIVARIFNTN